MIVQRNDESINFQTHVFYAPEYCQSKLSAHFLPYKFLPHNGLFISYYVQWGSEIRPFEIWKHLKSQLFDGWISNSLVLAMAIDIAPTIRKPDHLKSKHFCPDFKCFLTKWGPFVWISNGWAPRFQIPFEIQTICNPTSYLFTIQNPDQSRFHNSAVC